MAPKKRARTAARTGECACEDGAGGDRHIADELYCPITHQLFVDAVVAADGITYERSAIETHFKRSDKSPVHNVPIPRELRPLRLMPEIVARAINNNLVDADSADAWRARMDEAQRKADRAAAERKRMEKAAERGERGIMRLAAAYDSGTHGFQRSLEKAKEVLQRGIDAGMLSCTFLLGMLLLRRSPGDPSGMSLIATAGLQGHAQACILMGSAFAAHGSVFSATEPFVPSSLRTHQKSDRWAGVWLRKGLEADESHTLRKEHRNAVEAWLEQHEPRGAAEARGSTDGARP